MGDRLFTRVTAVWPSGSPTSSALPVQWGHYALGQLGFSGGWTDSHISIQQYMWGLWLPILDNQCGYTGVSIPSASGNAVIEMPEHWFVAGREDRSVRLWSHDGTGSAVPQESARTVVVDLKT